MKPIIPIRFKKDKPAIVRTGKKYHYATNFVAHLDIQNGIFKIAGESKGSGPMTIRKRPPHKFEWERKVIE